jgi:hypothetical protein
MADLKQAFGSSTAITATLASITGAGAARESTVVDNGTNLFLDVMVYVAVKLQAGSPSGDRAIFIWAYASEDGTNYTDNATGSDAAITLRVPTNLRPLGTINTPDSGGLTYKSGPMSLAAAFGGVIPRKWGIVVQNLTGVTFSATEGDHAKSYTGIYYQTV